MNDRSRRRKVLDVSDSLLVQILAEGVHDPFEVVADALPADARIVDVRFSAFHQPGHNTLELLVESAEFEPIGEGQPYPHMATAIRRITPEPSPA